MSLGACCSNKTFTVIGEVPGAKDSTKVYLQSAYAYPVEFLDSTYVIDGKFICNGEVPFPEYVELAFDLSPRERYGYKDDSKSYRFFIENSKINFYCEVDSLPSMWYESPSKSHNVKLTGSKTQDLHQALIEQNKELSKESKTLYDRYLDIYNRPSADGVFNTKDGIKIVVERIDVQNKIVANKKEFIKANLKSIVAIHVIKELVNGKPEISYVEMEGLAALIDSSLYGSKTYVEMLERIQAKKPTAIGEMYTDINLVDTKGDSVKLSDYIDRDRYTMLEFWASWCGPCRGEIPHLKHVNSVYGDQLNMVSISIDTNKDAWHQALTEEKMNWHQLCGYAPVTGIYNILGIPYCLILDKDGKIINGGLRGAELDYVLMSLFGDNLKL